VVLEAFAAGVPVVGSGIGGIAELVHDGIDGLLVHGAAASAWARTLTRLVSDAGLLVRLKSGVQPPRRMSHLTNDMLTIYGNVLRRRPANP
jgi:glycosyltransferase involved in cell wall biosynthesis